MGNATNEEHGWEKWEEGKVVERVMWARWRGNTRLIWVHKIIRQVEGGWEIEMRETTKNSKEKKKTKDIPTTRWRSERKMR